MPTLITTTIPPHDNVRTPVYTVAEPLHRVFAEIRMARTHEPVIKPESERRTPSEVYTVQAHHSAGLVRLTYATTSTTPETPSILYLSESVIATVEALQS